MPIIEIYPLMHRTYIPISYSDLDLNPCRSSDFFANVWYLAVNDAYSKTYLFLFFMVKLYNLLCFIPVLFYAVVFPLYKKLYD